MFAWHDIGEGRRVYRRAVEPLNKRADLPCPMVIGDTMDAVQAQTDGSWHESKSGIRANYRRHGVIEVGNEKLPQKGKRKPDRASIKDSVERAEARWNRGERV